MEKTFFNLTFLLRTFFIVTFISISVAVGTSFADTITVNTLDDELNTGAVGYGNPDGDCSFREAIATANVNQEIDDCTLDPNDPNTNDTIIFDSALFSNGPETIFVKGGALDAVPDSGIFLLQSLTIEGPQNTALHLDGDKQNRLFYLNGSNSTTLTIRNIQIRDFIAASQEGGGAILVNPGNALVLNNVTLSNNFSPYSGGAISIMENASATLSNTSIRNNFSSVDGGAITNNGYLTLQSVPITENKTGRNGGGIYNQQSGVLTVTDSNFNKNMSDSLCDQNGLNCQSNNTGNGGGIYNEGTTTLNNVLFSLNVGHNGGAIYNLGTFTSNNSRILGNDAIENGGGIYSENGAVYVHDSDISLNNGNGFGGGGFYIQDGIFEIDQNSTISENEAGSGGGIYAAAGNIKIRSTLIDKNSAQIANGGAILNTDGVLEISEGSIFSNNFAEIHGGAIFNLGETTITDSTFTQNQANIKGGGIFMNFGPMDISNTLFEHNSANGGGAIYAYDDTTIKGSIFTENYASEDGGAIWNDSTSELTINNTNFSNNFSDYVCNGNTCQQNSTYEGNGGGIFNQGNVNLDEVTFENNYGTLGGGIYNEHKFNIKQSSFYENRAVKSGGGIFSTGPQDSTIQNSTISGNFAAGNGGGIFNGGNLNLQNNTIAFNHADCELNNGVCGVANGGSGGGIFNTASADVLIENTILSNNVDESGETPDCSSPAIMFSTGNNIISDNTGCNVVWNVNNDFVDEDPELEPLALNAPGTTMTHAITENSIAFNQGKTIAGITTDQRGVVRPQGAGFDIGAFEVRVAQGADVGIEKTVSDNTPNLGDTVNFVLTVTNSGPGSAFDIVVTDDLFGDINIDANDLTVGSITPLPGTTCTINAQGVVTFTLTELTSGSSATCTIPVTVKDTAPSSFTNTATITDVFAVDNNAANDTDSVTLTVGTTGSGSGSGSGSGGSGGSSGGSGGGGGGSGCVNCVPGGTSPSPSPVPTPEDPNYGAGNPPDEPYFTDIDGNFAEVDIEALAQECKVLGYKNEAGELLHLFKPDMRITREELVTMLVLCRYDNIETPTGNPFPDVPKDRWSAGAIQKAKQEGIIAGFPDGKFKPTALTTRDQALKMILLTFQDAQEIENAAVNNSCTDIDQTQWYAKYFNFGLANNVISGFKDASGNPTGKCGPAVSITRAETAKIIIKSKAL